MVNDLVVWLLARNRRTKQLTMMVADSFIVIFAAWLAFSIRLSSIHEPNFPQLVMILAGPVIAIPLFYGFGLYRSLIRYVGEHAIWSAFKAVGLTALLWGVLAFMIRAYGVEGLPRSVLVLFWLLTLIMVISSRFLARWFLLLQTDSPRPQRHIIIYGAGEAARQISASLKSDNPRLSVLHVVEDPNLQGSLMGGDAVYLADDVTELIKRYDIKDAIVTLRTASNIKRVKVVETLRKQGVKVRILPAFADIADGKHAVNMIREVEIGDLLGREMVTPDKQLMAANTSGKVVMVTGGGGTIGSELCRQAASLGAAKLVLMETSEFALYQVINELGLQAEMEIVPVLGSVNDSSLVRRVIREHKVQTVFHAAAYKHVTLVQANSFEGVRNNALGTLSVASAVYDTDAEVLVLISTDKAVCPSSVMGASKRIAELIVQDFAARAKLDKPEKTFCAVRFGNVIGSSGSVIPLFRRQIRNGGPLTITHPQATRYFMSIEEAAQLVIQAGSIARPENQTQENRGNIFILDMGEPVRIMDMAVKLIELSNLTVCDEDNPDGDIAIKEIGLRPGEKLHEVLLESVEPPHPTIHPKISVALEPPPEQLDLEQLYRDLDSVIAAQDHDRLMDLLASVTARNRQVEPAKS
ncbi:MAG: polysaccharide biosynthesis protein [Hoeflea sp.]|uniref:polysaccharide biosynthesis protein n=1 Tax=Hoeflea sp. TaxID=1940281 RepID=UPI001DC229B6|nr:nucleoside-diphosphate sugar epimerase/dehydratase [Hoeflea sp.]MBU4531574.1 polysaccharide biosynthesis protein [Alphaproteobacteria bacterium]MBU4544431.1 polysaccharide biosynthesis protein [Alphaproteobacteria bacterium]MBU4550332.1 polysaccharide biosynthesis protein [Alphaproteobacteria bacterium]MBV1724850.1 polysaccharide biosynthesis protein [Hoeflea sp.]MBV1760870.1 polysaccharide biosynthesis protein [Hoeflea sp.]